jgi:hypothetical protein
MMRFAILLAFLALSCCSTTGVEVSDNQAKQFVIGQSTISEVEAKLGAPTSNTTDSDGTETISYKISHNHYDPMAYVPILGAFSYGSKSDVHQVNFVFAPSGVLQSYNTNDTQQ